MSEKVLKTQQKIVLLKKNRIKNDEPEKKIKPKIILRRESSINKINQEFKSVCSSMKKKKYFKVIEYIDDKNYNINVFIGKQKPILQKILNKIEKNMFEYLEKSEKEILKNNFGNRYEKIVGITNNTDGNINFINDLIHLDDSINIINTKIYIHLSNKKKSKFIPKNFQNLWIKKIKKIKVDELIQIFYAFTNGKKTINSEEILNLIEKYSGIRYDLKKLNIKKSSVFSINDFIKNKSITQKFDIVEIPLLYEYKNNFGKVYNIQNIYNKINIENFSESENFNQEQKYNSLTGNILEDFGHIKDNVIYLIDLNKVLNFSKKKPSPLFYKNIVKKYWPKVNINSIINNKDKYILDIAKHYTNIYGLVKNIGILDNTVENAFSSSLGNINFSTCGVLFTVIHVNFFTTQKSINLSKIFNILKLDETIPFIKFKEDENSEIKYKIYKPEIQNKKNYISEKDLNNWRKNIIVEKNGKQKISGIPKGLSIKQLLYKNNNEKKYSTINIMKDGKIEIKLYWKEDKQSSLNDIVVAVKKCYNLIQKINNIIYTINNNSKNIILLPDIKFLYKPINLYSNTKLTFLNTILSIQLTESLDFNILKNICKSFYNIVNVIDESALRKEILHLRYKRISNYEEMNDINTFISRQYTLNPNSKTIIQNIQLNYNISLTEAQTKFLFWTNQIKANENIYGLQKIIELKSEPGIDIKIQNLQVGGRYKIMIVGIRSINQLRRINFFLRSIFYLFDNYSNLDEKLRREITFKNTEKIIKDIQILEKDDLEFKDSGDNKTFNQVQQNIVPLNSNVVKVNMLSISSSESDDEDSNSYTDSDGDEDSDIDNDNKGNSSDKNQKKVSEESSSSEIISEEEKPLHQTNIREYELKRLYNADPKLFKFSGKKMFGAYSTICGSVDQRQPIVITEKEKEKIDKEHPGSYTFALKYGSNYKRMNYYICPEIWCIRCNVSLTKKEILNSQYGKNTCPKCKGTLIPIRKKRNNTNIIPEGATLLVKSATYWTRGSSTPYPGFIEPGKHPKSLCMPCCFKKWNSPQHVQRRKICTNSQVEVNKDIRNKNEKYIKGPEKFPLEKGKLGMLPKVLNNLFGNDITKMITKGKSGLLNNDIPCFLRKGISQSLYNSFILAIGNIYSDKLDDYARVKNTEPDIFFIENIILKNITPKIFISLNKGDLFNIFRENKKLDNESYFDFRNWYLNNSQLLDSMFLTKLTKAKYKKYSDIQSFSDDEKKSIQHVFNIFNSYQNFINYMYSESVKF